MITHPDLAEVRVDAPENIDFNSGCDQAEKEVGDRVHNI